VGGGGQRTLEQNQHTQWREKGHLWQCFGLRDQLNSFWQFMQNLLSCSAISRLLHKATVCDRPHATALPCTPLNMSSSRGSPSSPDNKSSPRPSLPSLRVPHIHILQTPFQKCQWGAMGGKSNLQLLLSSPPLIS
jgi:hypothetical protein